ncbi:MAG: NADH-quinone oxidoreductase subunit J [SAR324 cluster bacterium]|nr:NADH-quinone oxidoreductase subunit J [SAR324 cluster bacterium]
MEASLLSNSLFWVLGSVAIIAASVAVLAPNPMYSGLSLMLIFFVLAAIYIWMKQEYFGAMQLLIYVGAIMVLFIFMIMLLNTRTDFEEINLNWRWGTAFLLSIGLMSVLIPAVVNFKGSLPVLGNYTENNIELIGASELFAEALWEKSILIVELMSILLLVGVLGAVVLTKKNYTDQI